METLISAAENGPLSVILQFCLPVDVIYGLVGVNTSFYRAAVFLIEKRFVRYTINDVRIILRRKEPVREDILLRIRKYMGKTMYDVNVFLQYSIKFGLVNLLRESIEDPSYSEEKSTISRDRALLSSSIYLKNTHPNSYPYEIVTLMMEHLGRKYTQRLEDEEYGKIVEVVVQFLFDNVDLQSLHILCSLFKKPRRSGCHLRIYPKPQTVFGSNLERKRDQYNYRFVILENILISKQYSYNNNTNNLLKLWHEIYYFSHNSDSDDQILPLHILDIEDPKVLNSVLFQRDDETFLRSLLEFRKDEVLVNSESSSMIHREMIRRGFTGLMNNLIVKDLSQHSTTSRSTCLDNISSEPLLQYLLDVVIMDMSSQEEKIKFLESYISKLISNSKQQQQLLIVELNPRHVEPKICELLIKSGKIGFSPNSIIEYCKFFFDGQNHNIFGIFRDLILDHNNSNSLSFLDQLFEKSCYPEIFEMVLQNKLICTDPGPSIEYIQSTLGLCIGKYEDKRTIQIVNRILDIIVKRNKVPRMGRRRDKEYYQTCIVENKSLESLVRIKKQENSRFYGSDWSNYEKRKKKNRGSEFSNYYDFQIRERLFRIGDISLISRFLKSKKLKLEEEERKETLEEKLSSLSEPEEDSMIPKFIKKFRTVDVSMLCQLIENEDVLKFRENSEQQQQQHEEIENFLIKFLEEFSDENISENFVDDVKCCVLDQEDNNAVFIRDLWEKGYKDASRFAIGKYGKYIRGIHFIPLLKDEEAVVDSSAFLNFFKEHCGENNYNLSLQCGCCGITIVKDIFVTSKEEEEAKEEYYICDAGDCKRLTCLSPSCKKKLRSGGSFYRYRRGFYDNIVSSDSVFPKETETCCAKCCAKHGWMEKGAEEERRSSDEYDEFSLYE